MSIAINISPEQRDLLLAMLERTLPNTMVWAFGSRVKGTARSSSDLDLDLVVFSSTEQQTQVAALREALEESMLPFPVDVLVWGEIPDSFKRNIEQCYQILVQAKSDHQSTENGTRAT